MELSFDLTDRKSERVLYISTDEANRTFFEPFARVFKAVRFLSDFSADVENMNQNHMGMVEQVRYILILVLGTQLSIYAC